MNYTVNNNEITAIGNINDGDGAKFITILSELEESHKQITIKLHTYGGSVFDGNLIYNAILNSKAQITIHIIGVCASMGAIIALSIDSVYMVENGYIMLHAPSSGAFGNADELESNARLLRLIEANFIKKLQQKTGKSEDYVKTWLNGDNWFDANQSLQEGLIKGVLNSETDFKANFNPNNLTTKEAFNRFTALFYNDNFNTNNMDLKQELIKKFGLVSSTSNTNILNKIEQNQQLKSDLIELLKLDDDVSDEDIINKVKQLLETEQEIEEEKETEARLLIADARRKNKLIASQEEHIMNMFRADFRGTKRFLESMSVSKAPNISALIKGKGVEKNDQKKPKSEWSLDDYRKYAPKELANNPKLYNSLKKEKFNN